jgi:hypothetical protein
LPQQRAREVHQLTFDNVGGQSIGDNSDWPLTTMKIICVESLLFSPHQLKGEKLCTT